MSPGEPGQRLVLLERFQQQHRTGILTLLFTDLVDSTRLKQELGDAKAVGLIQQHHARVRDWLKEFPDAQEIETAGDSFLVVFARPSDGVRFALGLHTRNRQLSAVFQAKIEDRVGILAGEVFVHDQAGDAKLFGSQVDLCGRILNMAQGGQVLLTRFVFDNARAVVVALHAALASPGRGQATGKAAGATLTVTLGPRGGDWRRAFNPFRDDTDTRFPATAGVYEPLLVYNRATRTYHPWLATAYRWGTGNTTLRVVIRPGVVWSDGAPFSVRDVAFTFDLMRRVPALDRPGVWGFPADVKAVDATTQSSSPSTGRTFPASPPSSRSPSWPSTAGRTWRSRRPSPTRVRSAPAPSFAIASEKELIGAVGIHLQEDVNRFSAEIGYWLGEPFWNKGIISQALKLFTEFAFTNFELNRIFANVFEGNDASEKVLLKCGYKKEAILRKAVFKEGKFIDQYIYALLKDEYIKLK